MRRQTAISHKDCIKKALEILDQCCPEVAHAQVEPGEVLLQKVNILAADRREISTRLERVEKELAVFRAANSETSRLLEKKIEELSLLRLITDTTSCAIMSHDPFKTILDRVITIVGADAGSIVLLDPETGCFEVRAAIGQENSQINESLTRLTEEAAACVDSSGKPSQVEGDGTDPHVASLNKKDLIIGPLGSFPLVVEDKIVGVLNVSSSRSGALDAETERILHIIAGQIAVTVQNVRLYGEVKKTKEYLENLVERAGDAIFTLDRSHTVVSWNKGAEAIFHRDKQSVLGVPIYDLIEETNASVLREQIGSVLNSENIGTIEADAVRGDGQTTQIALTLSPIRDANGEVVGVSGIAKDITERKRVEEELRRLSDAKSNFVSTVSHELRTPLTSIKSFVEILLHDMASLPEDTVQRYLNIMNDECDRLSGLISSVLDLQKLGAGRLDVRMKPVLLADIARQAADLFDGVALPSRIELTRQFNVPDEMTRILGDRKRLMQILTNLLSNAIKYTNVGGHVYIIVDRKSEGVKVTVADDGIGIPESETDKVFEKFYRVDNPLTREKGGTGLGLAITKELVALHGGKIWVESQVGKGCSFHILIPPAE